VHTTYLGSRPTLRWGRFSPPSSKLLEEVKQIFDISATLGLRTAKTLRCIRTNFSGFIDIREVNKSPYFYSTPQIVKNTDFAEKSIPQSV